MALSRQCAGHCRCADKLKQGDLVALPTETVYGLAGDATNGDAIAAIYATKARPQFNPLICHVADMKAARAIGRFNEQAEKLAAAFWPGPLTLVVPRQADCPVDPLASAGLDTIALRIPAHETAQKLLRVVARPLVAPSANPSGRLSPAAAHVAAMLPDIDVLDGGACAIGLESSIIGCLDDTPLWLRAGGLARADIEACLGTKRRAARGNSHAGAHRAGRWHAIMRRKAACVSMPKRRANMNCSSALA